MTTKRKSLVVMAIFFSAILDGSTFAGPEQDREFNRTFSALIQAAEKLDEKGNIRDKKIRNTSAI